MTDRSDAGPEGAPDDVKHRVEEIQRRHRGRIRWRITKHTAELAIKAISDAPRQAPKRRGKSRRRKRYKRLL